jgi:O-antigen ligase
LVSAATTLVALLDAAPPLRGQVPAVRAARALITVGIGLGFFLASIRMASSRARLMSSVRWLLVGMGVAVSWGLLQGSRLLFRWPYYAPLNAVQRLISTWDLHETRVTGLTYEPSWFADQLAVLVVPMLLAGLLTGGRLFLKRRGGWLLEACFLAAALVCLVLTYSRSGLVTLVGAAAVGIAVSVPRWWRAVARQEPRGSWLRRGIPAVLAGLVGLGVLAWLASRNTYLQLLWTRLWTAGDVVAYMISLGGGTRFALAVASWGIFRSHPWIGVGLGQSGFRLFDFLPDWATERNPEMLFMLSPTSWTFPNPKNLWMRLLSETGLTGSLLFGLFLVLVLLGALVLLRGPRRVDRFFGTFGLMAWVAIALSGLSLDSFALPTIWIALGLVTAGIQLRSPPADTPPPSAPEDM